MSVRNLLQRAWGWIVELVEDAVRVLGSDAARDAIRADLGLPLQGAPTPLALPADRIAGIKAYRDAQSVDFHAFASAVGDFLVILETFDAFFGVDPEGPAENARENTYRALLLLGTDFIRLRVPVAYFAGQIARLLIDRPDRTKEIFAAIFDAGEDDTAGISAATLLPAAILLSLLAELKVLPEVKVLYGWDETSASPTPVADELSRRMLSFEFVGKVKDEPGSLDGKLGLTLVWVPEAHGGPGLLATLHGSGEIILKLGKEWQARMKVASTGAVDVLIRKDDIDFHGPSDATVAVTVESTRKTEEVGPFVLGTTTGTRFEFTRPTFTFSGSKDDISVKAVMKKSAIVLKREEADAFTKGALQSAGSRIEIDFGIGWSKKKELFIEGGSGLKVSLPLDRSLGPVRLRQLHLALGGDNFEQRRIDILLTFDLRIKGFLATFDRTGYVFDATAITKLRELSGPDTDILTTGFKGPDGIGLLLDTKVAKGGGYLFWDDDAGLYAGVGQIEFRGYLLSVFCLITTRLQDGSEGTSVVFIVNSDIPTVNLPFCLRWTGVGGIIGHNRSADVEALRAGLRGGALDGFLFPRNAVADAPRTLTVLQTVMPATDGQFMAGLFFRLEWLYPTVGSLEFGLILEFDDPWRLIIIGQIRVALPNERKILLLLQMDFLGVVDWERDEVSFDAVLRDSRIRGLVLTGDVAFRSRWSGDRYALLAAGGFHPAFVAPEGFPRLNRIAVEWARGDSVKLRLEGYVAYSSNTRQFGGRIDVLVRAAGFSVEAYLGVDVLLELFPPGFVAHIQAGATVKWHGRTLFGVDLDFTWSAFVPSRVEGHATFKVWRFSKTIPFGKDIDDSEEIPPPPVADPMPTLVAALREARNWGAELPPLLAATLLLREGSAVGEVLVHPLGELSVRQSVVPLGIEIDLFGSGVPPLDRRFDLSILVDGEASPHEPVFDQFAPGLFLQMSDAEKLRAPSFEPMQSGVRLGSGLRFGGDLDETLIGDAPITYDTVPPEGAVKPPEPLDVTLGELHELLLAERYVPPASRLHEFRETPLAVGVSRPRYLVARTTDLESVAVEGIPASGTRSRAAAAQALKRHRREHPGEADDLQVISVLAPEGR